jgi:hypothetical protein
MHHHHHHQQIEMSESILITQNPSESLSVAGSRLKSKLLLILLVAGRRL